MKTIFVTGYRNKQALFDVAFALLIFMLILVLNAICNNYNNYSLIWYFLKMSNDVIVFRCLINQG
jgi:hypothetical protein